MCLNLLTNTIDKLVLENYCDIVFVDQTIIICYVGTSEHNFNKFAYQTFINSLTKFERIWMINRISKQGN